jgi:hypothetical protein
VKNRYEKRQGHEPQTSGEGPQGGSNPVTASQASITSGWVWCGVVDVVGKSATAVLRRVMFRPVQQRVVVVSILGRVRGEREWAASERPTAFAHSATFSAVESEVKRARGTVSEEEGG